MDSPDPIKSSPGPNSNASIFLKIQNQLEESRKISILSAFDFIRWKSPQELKEAARYSTALHNLHLGNIYTGYLHGFKQRTVHQSHILSIQAKRHDIVDFDSDLENQNSYYIKLISKVRVMFTPKLIDFDPTGNAQAVDMLAETRNLLEKRNMDANDNEIMKQLIDRKISLTRNDNEILRWKKQKAWIMRNIDHKSRLEIIGDLSITINQYKDAIKNWPPNRLMEIHIEKRGAHKKTNSVRSADNLRWVSTYISQQDRPVTAKEVLKAFQDQKLGKKCSKSLIYKMIKDDLNLKFGVPKRYMKEKNSIDNKSYRIYVCQKLLESFSKGIKVVSIDETGFSDYIDKMKTWYDPSNRIQMEISKKKQTVSYSLLLATSQDYVIGYFLVEGAVNSAMYLSFIKNVVEQIPYRLMEKYVVIAMDNARIHKSIVVKDYMARQTKHDWLYMPAYSPEINFIENVFNRIKRTYKKMPVTNNK